MEKDADRIKSKKSKKSLDDKASSVESFEDNSKSEDMMPLQELKHDLEKSSDIEEKIKKSIEFMKEALSQKGTPRFRDFWEAKKMCLPLFKEKINPVVKAQFWNEYIELSSEAKRLKEILDEQSSFAVEQIELALNAVEDDVKNHEELIKKIKPLEMPKDLCFMQDKLNRYERMQNQISFYMTLSARTKDLRQEIIQNEMRVKCKNRLLEKLSKLADDFLPKKKELIKEISAYFLSDVKDFAGTYFDLEKKVMLRTKTLLFKIREEIKAFQAFAKSISLNSHTFAESRLILSNCWSILKEEEKRLRTHQMEKKKDFEEKILNFRDKMKGVEEFFNQNVPGSKEDVYKKTGDLLKLLKDNNLPKAEFINLKKDLHVLEEKILEPIYQKEKDNTEKILLEEKEEREKILQIKEKYINIVKNETTSLHDYKKALEELNLQLKTLKLDFVELLKFSEIQKELYENLLLKKEEEFDFTVEGSDQSLQGLFLDWENFREETRSGLESYRKEMGRSGFDFEKAMLYREYMDLEKERLDRIVQKIEELEDKI